MKKIRVMLVDDSAFIRVALKNIIECEDITICGVARDGLDALEKVKLYLPDVIMLDVEMPNMNGLEFLKEYMKNPKRASVIMFSSLTREGADVTLQALNLGAVDFLLKPTKYELDKLENLRERFRQHIRAAAGVDVQKVAENLKKLQLSDKPKVEPIKPEISKAPAQPIKSLLKPSKKIELCLIGTSTGGPPALQKVFECFQENLPFPIVVVQHMPKGFTKSLAERLDAISKLEVKESEQGDIVKPGRALIAQAGYQIGFMRQNNEIVIKHIMPKAEDLFKPAVNDMIFNAMQVVKPENILCVIMTGMGNDGLLGIRELKKQGSFVIAESEESAVVFGMPGVVVKENLADKILPVWEIGKEIVNLAK